MFTGVTVITIVLLQIYKQGDISMDTNVLVPYKQTCTAGEEQQSQQFQKYEATFVTLVHDPSNEMVLLRTVFWKRSAQQVIISEFVVLKADPANNPTQSTGGRNRIPAMQALTRDTQVPVIMALNTIDEMSPLLGGHMEDRPPITIPSELKLAKPQRA